MQPQPPRVAVSTPDTSPVTGDVLTSGSERPPWRPSRVQKRLAGVLLILALLAAAGGGWRQRSLHAAALDRASVAAVQLTALYDADAELSSDSAVGLTVQNAGPRPVRLLTARLLLPGFSEAHTDATIGRGSQLTLAIPLPAATTCAPDRSAPVLVASLRVVALTDRGRTVTRDLPLTALHIEAIRMRARNSCGFLPVAHAFENVTDDLRAEGDSVLLTIRVRNGSALPFRWERLSAFPGLSVSISPSLPLTLRPEPGGVFTTVHIRLRLTSCSAMRRESTRLRGEGQNPSGFSVFAAAELTATLAHDAGLYDITIYPVPESHIEAELPKALADLLRCTDPS